MLDRSLFRIRYVFMLWFLLQLFPSLKCTNYVHGQYCMDRLSTFKYKNYLFPSLKCTIFEKKFEPFDVGPQLRLYAPIFLLLFPSLKCTIS
jgi:hypothetical protein